MPNHHLDRRTFLKKSALAAASAALLPKFCRTFAQSSSSPRIRGANDDIRIAVVGFHGRGQEHISAFGKMKGVRIVGLCDLDSKVLDAEVKKFKDRGEDVTGYRDIRKLLENPDIDAISIATPNHWHSLASIWAVQAGKDVYVEKPVSHNVWEGGQVVKAARKYNRIVQAGTQSRSSVALQEAMAWLHGGGLGKIKLARGLCYKRRPSIGKTSGPQQVPASIDYDLWLGPAPMEPLRRKRLHYDWHWVWPTGNGDVGNQGIHQMDIARWALGEPELSPQVLSVGGRLGYDDDGTTPNTLLVYHEYKNAPLLFEVRGLPQKEGTEKMDAYKGESIGVVVHCENGYMAIPSSYSAVHVFDNDGKEIKSFKGGGNHFENFIKGVRSRRMEDLHADIAEGNISSALCHTGNISYRLGKQKKPDALRAAIRDDADLAEAFGRMQEHLGANGVNLDKTPATLGVLLKMDPQTQRFIGNRKANSMLTRDYRKPFVVPENV